ncbi:hypothetical protein KXR53_31765 [Inquilinus limosus]|uniref:hypothetical protein n=1 Tax=Inquilinus limosus TaxID=171674 RepID=UPI003F16D156
MGVYGAGAWLRAKAWRGHLFFGVLDVIAIGLVAAVVLQIAKAYAGLNAGAEAVALPTGRSAAGLFAWCLPALHAAMTWTGSFPGQAAGRRQPSGRRRGAMGPMAAVIFVLAIASAVAGVSTADRLQARAEAAGYTPCGREAGRIRQSPYQTGYARSEYACRAAGYEAGD